jgi:hypothetical protein
MAHRAFADLGMRVIHPLVLRKSAQAIEGKRDEFRSSEKEGNKSVQMAENKGERRTHPEVRRIPGIPHPPGHLYEYQKKGIAGEGVCKSKKERRLRIQEGCGIVRIGLGYTKQSNINMLSSQEILIAIYS